MSAQRVTTPWLAWETGISQRRRRRQVLLRWPIFSATVLIIVSITAIFGPLISPHDPVRGSLEKRNIPPMFFGGTSEHILGTDPVGRDILSRLIYGARISLTVVAVTLLSGGGFGTLVGLISGYAGGWVDEILMRITDIKFALPLLLIALALVVVLGSSFGLLLGLLAFLIWGGFARQVRAEVLSLKEREYVKLAKVAGASPVRIVYKHIFPGVFSTVQVVGTSVVGGVILAEASLSFLGAGVPPPTPSWGAMVAEGRTYLASAWWVSLIPGLVIGVVVLAFVLLGDWLRDQLDPRLRQL